MTIPKSCPFAPASILNARGKNESQLGGRGRRRHPNPGTKHKNRASLAAAKLVLSRLEETRGREGGRPEKQSRGIKGASEGAREDGRTQQPRMRKHEGKGRASRLAAAGRFTAFASHRTTRPVSLRREKRILYILTIV